MTPLALVVLFFFLVLPVLVTMYVLRSGRVREDRGDPPPLPKSLGRTAPPRWVRTLIVSAGVWVAVTGLTTLLHSSKLAIWLGGVVIAGGAVAVYRAIQMPYKLDDEAFDKALRDLLDRSDS